MIQGTYYKEWSRMLGREMEFKVYGTAGVPVLALPARGGRFYDWENNGMPEAVASLLSSGKLQLFTAPAKQEGISALQANHGFAFLRFLQQHLIDLLLRHGVLVCTLSYVDESCRRRYFCKYALSHQTVIDDHICGLDQLF